MSKKNRIEPSNRNIIVTYLGNTGAAAAALTMRRLQSSELVITNQYRVLERLKEMAAGLGANDHVIITGAGCASTSKDMIMALRILTGNEIRVTWFGKWPDFIEKASECCDMERVEFVLDPSLELGDLISSYYKNVKGKHDQDLISLANGKFDRKNANHRMLETLYETNFLRYATFDDMNALPDCIRKMAFPDSMDRIERQRIDHQMDEHPRSLLGRSKAIRELKKHIRLMAPVDRFDVLITGESGTGKEIVARLLHEYSPRKAAPFIPVSCANFTDSMFESTLFGHVKGAFTGAVSESPGFLGTVGKGTLFFDEVGEIPLNQQARLLRVLQERSYFQVGSAREKQTPARIVCATNRDLAKLVKEGKFRLDLYHRLHSLVIRTPALREHPEDIPTLAKAIISRYSYLVGREKKRVEGQLKKELITYNWPGNVRQLENVLKMCIVLDDWDIESHIRMFGDTSDHRLTCDPVESSPHFESRNRNQAGGDAVERAGLRTLEEAEAEAVREAYVALGKAKGATAKALGITYNTLRAKLEKYGIDD